MYSKGGQGTPPHAHHVAADPTPRITPPTRTEAQANRVNSLVQALDNRSVLEWSPVQAARPSAGLRCP